MRRRFYCQVFILRGFMVAHYIPLYQSSRQYSKPITKATKASLVHQHTMETSLVQTIVNRFVCATREFWLQTGHIHLEK